MRKRKILKGVIIAISGLVIAVAAVAAVMLWLNRDTLMWNRSYPIAVTAPDIDSSKMSDFAADALYMVSTIESVHPVFVLDGFLPDDYESERDAFLAYAQNDISQEEFIFAAWKYIATLQDGHITGFQAFSHLSDALSSDLLDVSWGVRGGRLYLRSDDRSLTDVEVAQIGGASPQDIFKLVDQYFFAENEVDRARVHAFYARYGTFIELAGGEIASGSVRLTLLDGGEAVVKDVPLDWLERQNESGGADDADYIIRLDRAGDILVIDFRTFADDGAVIDEAVSQIEAAIADGTRKFIVDLRGNGGGNSWHGQRLLQAMGVTAPNYGAVRRFSDLYFEQATWLTTFERLQGRLVSPIARGQVFAPDASVASNPNGVFVSVLTDNSTYSSATMMAVWVQDGGFGNIIGSPSSNAPSAFGDMLRFELPYSGLTMRVSYTRFLRPDANADQNILMPDIEVDPADALDVALEYLGKLVSLKQ